MDDIVKEARSEADERFDTARVTAAVDALAAEHSGREDVFRAAVAKLLKAEMIAARETAQAGDWPSKPAYRSKALSGTASPLCSPAVPKPIQSKRYAIATADASQAAAETAPASALMSGR